MTTFGDLVIVQKPTGPIKVDMRIVFNGEAITFTNVPLALAEELQRRWSFFGTASTEDAL